ncbi:MAG: hypothetical protein HGA66_03180 [Holophaga sp.]|nr:hypothetical protein [Holophaga sp.]
MRAHSNPVHALFQKAFCVCALTGCLAPLAGAPPEAPKAMEKHAEATTLVEAFRKGPVSITAKVIRAQGTPEEASLPMFQVPVLKFQDRLDLSFSGEAFDPRVTRADWSLIVVFLPKTVAPTDQGVVSCRLKRKGDEMAVPSIPVPYDSIPMIFLVPDKNGRKKVLKDLNTHLETFRNLCAKIFELSEERAAVDKFLEDLDAIDKNLSPAQYDNAVLGFLHSYGNAVSGDLQAFLGSSRSNLAKFQFITQEFRKTNVLVPESGSAPVEAQVTAEVGGNRPISAYVSIFFDLASIIKNLWPGHQFQYLPALARNFHGASADLYYGDWIHTTGDTLGALMCCPGQWEDLTPPAFELELPGGESLLKNQALLKVRPREKNRNPFALFGHDWKLLVTGPRGEALPPLGLTANPGKASFVASPAPLQEPLRKLGAAKVQVRVVGRWGFTSIATDPLELPVGVDPAWVPAPEERAAFRIGKACAFELPRTWAPVVAKVAFRPARPGAAPLLANLTDRKDGARSAVFQPRPDQAGAGVLEILTFGQDKPALAVPVTLLEAPPEPAGLEARLGEDRIVLKGCHLEGIQAMELGNRRFVPGGTDSPGLRTFRAEDGKPLDGTPGTKLAASMVLAADRKVPLENASLLAARPRLAEAQVVPVEVKATRVLVTSSLPIASTGSPSQVGLLAAKGYRFPSDRGFHAAIRNTDEPKEIRAIPQARIKVMGNNLKATFTFTPAELLGGRAAGRLEVQVVDDHCGASDWLPLPATFLDLPTIASVQRTTAGTRLTGPSLDAIEALAPSPAGPWEKARVAIEEGRESIDLAAPFQGGHGYLRVFGWPDLVLTLKFPALPPMPADPAVETMPSRPQ